MSNSIVITNIGELVTFCKHENEMLVYHDVEMVVNDGIVSEIGKNLVSPEFDKINACGNLVTPGFVDPHTHPIFNDTRELEFEMRVMGKSYMETAGAGGGILSSVKSFRSANKNALARKVRKRLDAFLRCGTTTIEVKSGYGLNVESELNSLRLIREIAKDHPLDIKTTFLGAHEYPPEYREDHQKYINIVVKEMLPGVVKEGLADFCDVFCEEGVFSIDESRQILEAAKSLGLGLRMHADEFQPIGGAQLAAELGASSADHLVAISDEGVSALSKGRVIPILLPATTFFLGSNKYAPARKMWDAGLSVALATDFNPGSSMTQSMPFVITLACLKMKLTPLEALQASTINAAKSLNYQELLGSLEPGKQADFVVWKFEKYQGIPYFLAFPSVKQVWKKGVKVWESYE